MGDLFLMLLLLCSGLCRHCSVCIHRTKKKDKHTMAIFIFIFGFRSLFRASEVKKKKKKKKKKACFCYSKAKELGTLISIRHRRISVTASEYPLSHLP